MKHNKFKNLRSLHSLGRAKKRAPVLKALSLLLMKCINCNNYKLTYWDTLCLAPRRPMLHPIHFSCPECEFIMKASSKSNWLFIISLLMLIFISTYLFHNYVGQPSDIEASILTIIVFGVCYLVIWPKALQLEVYSMEKVWLPKSRAVGYLVYFIFPLLLIIGLLALAVYFEWGI